MYTDVAWVWLLLPVGSAFVIYCKLKNVVCKCLVFFIMNKVTFEQIDRYDSHKEDIDE